MTERFGFYTDFPYGLDSNRGEVQKLDGGSDLPSLPDIDFGSKLMSCDLLASEEISAIL
jgi:hypothetical protein